MSLQVVVVVLTVLAAVVVVLTRLRLGRDGGAGRLAVGRRVVDVHGVVGSLALVTWTVLLVAGRTGLDVLGEGVATALGLVAVALWWVTAAVGLLVLVRWLPTRGRHASDGSSDRWSRGPGLSLLAHLGMVAGVVVFSYAYLVSAV